jgi:hypothetical protein
MKQCMIIVLFFVNMKNEVLAQQVSSQQPNPPIVSELTINNRGVMVQMITNKNFQSIPRLGFFGVSSILAEWDNNQINDLMSQGHLTWGLGKGLQAGLGYHLTPMTGIRPSASVIYTYHSKNWMFIANPRVDLTSNTNAEAMVLAEFKPKLTEKTHFYSRIQTLYVLNTTSGHHSRSYLMARAGLSVKEFTFGLAANSDYYGPMEINKNSIGVFVNYLLF